MEQEVYKTNLEQLVSKNVLKTGNNKTKPNK